MADAGKGPDLVSFRELAKRLVAEHVVPAISHQRVSQLSRDDPDFPPVVRVGRSMAVDWYAAEPYFRDRKSRQGRRTDLSKPEE
ncbi:hypothetical protein [Streptacidiphilus albus]|uniref:hypothetical protein n=1 Tax=Streptacidiphilus albus TaxID=105425 RepID=UPI001E60FE9E|nr:hypothetical protein [Streptacidiphilus albus]